MSWFNSISSYIYISLGILLFMFSGMLNGGRGEAGEVILALSATVDGQTTAHYLAERLREAGKVAYEVLAVAHLVVARRRDDLNLGHDFLKFCQVHKGHVNSAIACLSTFFLPEYAIYSLPK